ncbi:MAG: tetratricopeptide repeat protein [Planctomycetes bacterium]|nr:tetratricopeptide repeat protein [Planctomycetota bacterium]
MTEQAFVDQAMESYRLAHMIIEGKFGSAVAGAIPHLRTAADSWGKALQSKPKADCLVELGKLHQRLDDHAAAVPIYEDAIAIYRDLGEKQSVAYAGVLAGLALKAQRKYEPAFSYIERALAINQDGGDLTHVARTLGILAGVLMDMGMNTEALERHREAMPILTRFNKSVEIAQTHESMALCHHRLGNHAEAKEHFEKAVVGKTELGDLKGTAKVMHRYAELERARGAHDHALALHKRALEIHQLRNDQALIAQTLGNIGTVHADRGAWQEALEQFQRCLPLCQAEYERQAEVQALSNIALMQLNLGRDADALATITHTLTLCDKLDNRALHERVAKMELELQRKRGDADGELASLTRIAELRERSGDRAGLASILDDLAVLHHGRKNHDQAKTYLTRRADLLEDLGDQEGLVRTLDDLAALAVEREQWNEAADHFERGLAILRSRGLPAADLALRTYNLAIIHGKRLDPKLALDAYNQALESFRETGNGEQIARTLRQIGACELNLPERSGDALRHYQEALAYYEPKHDQRGIAISLVGIGNAHANLGDNVAAKEAFERAAALKEQMGDQKGTTMIRKATNALM